MNVVIRSREKWRHAQSPPCMVETSSTSTAQDDLEYLASDIIIENDLSCSTPSDDHNTRIRAAFIILSPQHTSVQSTLWLAAAVVLRDEEDELMQKAAYIVLHDLTDTRLNECATILLHHVNEQTYRNVSIRIILHEYTMDELHAMPRLHIPM